MSDAHGHDEDLIFQRPTDLRDRFRNLDQIVALTLATGEDPLVLATSAGFSPTALVRALPRSFLTRFVPEAESMSIPEIVIALTSNHALDVAVEGIVAHQLDARSLVTVARDVMDRASLIGQKKVQPLRRLELTDESLSKLAALERRFTDAKEMQSGQITPEFSQFHQANRSRVPHVAGGQEGPEEKQTGSSGLASVQSQDQGANRETADTSKARDREVWKARKEPTVRELLNLDD